MNETIKELSDQVTRKLTLMAANGEKKADPEAISSINKQTDFFKDQADKVEQRQIVLDGIEKYYEATSAIIEEMKTKQLNQAEIIEELRLNASSAPPPEKMIETQIEDMMGLFEALHAGHKKIESSYNQYEQRLSVQSKNLTFAFQLLSDRLDRVEVKKGQRPSPAQGLSPLLPQYKEQLRNNDTIVKTLKDLKSLQREVNNIATPIELKRMQDVDRMTMNVLSRTSTPMRTRKDKVKGLQTIYLEADRNMPNPITYLKDINGSMKRRNSSLGIQGGYNDVVDLNTMNTKEHDF